MDSSLPLSLVDRFLPHLGELWHALSTEWWLALLLLVLLSIIVRRHGIIFYGSELTSWAGVPLTLALFSAFALQPHVAIALYIGVLLVDVLVEKQLGLHGRMKRFFSLFDQGFIIGILSMIHPGFLSLSFAQLWNLRKRVDTPFRHFMAFLLGVLAALWICFILFAPPSLTGMQIYLREHFLPLTRIDWTSVGTKYLPLTLSLSVVQVLLTFITYKFVGTALERHRVYVQSHVRMMWLMFALYILYIGSRAGTLYLAGTLLLISILIQLYSNRRSDLFTLMLIYIPAAVVLYFLIRILILPHA